MVHEKYKYQYFLKNTKDSAFAITIFHWNGRRNCISSIILLRNIIKISKFGPFSSHWSIPFSTFTLHYQSLHKSKFKSHGMERRPKQNSVSDLRWYFHRKKNPLYSVLWDIGSNHLIVPKFIYWWKFLSYYVWTWNWLWSVPTAPSPSIHFSQNSCFVNVFT